MPWRDTRSGNKVPSWVGVSCIANFTTACLRRPTLRHVRLPAVAQCRQAQGMLFLDRHKKRPTATATLGLSAAVPLHSKISPQGRGVPRPRTKEGRRSNAAGASAAAPHPQSHKQSTAGRPNPHHALAITEESTRWEEKCAICIGVAHRGPDGFERSFS